MYDMENPRKDVLRGFFGGDKKISEVKKLMRILQYIIIELEDHVVKMTDGIIHYRCKCYFCRRIRYRAVICSIFWKCENYVVTWVKVW